MESKIKCALMPFLLIWLSGCGNKMAVFRVHQVRKYPAVAFYNKYMTECLDNDKSFSASRWAQPCPASLDIPLKDGQVLKLASIEDGNQQGNNGRTYFTVDKKFVVKSPYKETTGEDICRERAALKTLKGLDGITVKSADVQIGQSMTAECASRLIVMESAGSYTLETIKSAADSALPYTIAVRILEMIQRFHATGLVHGDPHNLNMIYSDMEDPVGSLKLIDLGFSVPYVTAEGELEESKQGASEDRRQKRSIYRDMVYIADVFTGLIESGQKADMFEEFKKEMEVLGDFDLPDYQGWIDKFKAKAKALESMTN